MAVTNCNNLIYKAVTNRNNLIYKAVTNRNNLICMLFTGNTVDTRWILDGGNKP